MDYQDQALFGASPNTSALDATMLNPDANGPADWATILTQGISGAAVNGINGFVNNAVNKGAINNAIAAQNGGLSVVSGRTHHGMIPLLLIGAVIYMLVS